MTVKNQLVDSESLEMLAAAACDARPVAGLTHNFYRYPARFSPVFAGTAIECLSSPGDLVMDPYMGGGTTVVESIARGRDAVGNDLNSLAHFIATVKTQLLCATEIGEVLRWADEIVPTLNYRASAEDVSSVIEPEKTRNLTLPRGRFIKKFIAAALSSIQSGGLSPNAQAFARCAVLRTGQWALDGRRTHTSLNDFRSRPPEIAREMVTAMDDLKVVINGSGGAPSLSLYNGDASKLEELPAFKEDGKRVDLVVTSPPYPGIHILYHRWQVDGRRETPAPYWIAGCQDGEGASYYNFADRRRSSDDKYFEVSLRTLKSIRKVMSDGAMIVQMIAFGRPKEQLPRYLSNMVDAGFSEIQTTPDRIWRSVPNRRWHASRKGKTSGANEVVLIHAAD